MINNMGFLEGISDPLSIVFIKHYINALCIE